jgi:hypothetical protein
MTPVQRLDVRARNYRGTLYLARDEDSVALTEVAAFVWRLIDGSRTVDDLATVVAAEYSIDRDTAHTDCAELVASLAEAGMLDLQEN